MSYDKDIPKFFLGANSPDGFFLRFNQLYYPNEGWFCYILKGGPGSGKSSLMKQIAAYALKRNIKPELIFCSSDPDSLDAVILNELKVSIVDGTSPHCLDPIYAGVSDKIINLGEYWDEKSLLANKDEILKSMHQNAMFHKRAKGYLKAYKGVQDSIETIFEKALNKEKIEDFSKRITKRLLRKVPSEKGKEVIRFISAVTPDGLIFFEDTVISICDEVYIIDDKFGVIGSFILKYIKEYGINSGHNVISCYSPFSPKHKLECLIFPKDKISFVVSNSNHSMDKLKNVGKTINAIRFADKDRIKSNIKLLNYDRKIECQLLNEAVKNLKSAKNIHDIIERFYIPSMNFKKVDNLTRKLTEKIFNSY